MLIMRDDARESRSVLRLVVAMLFASQVPHSDVSLCM